MRTNVQVVAVGHAIVDVLTREYDLGHSNVVFRDIAAQDAREALQSKSVNALLVVAGCYSFTVACRARTVTRGHLELFAAPGVSGIAVVDADPNLRPRLSIGARYGVTDAVELDARVGDSGGSIATRVQLVRAPGPRIVAHSASEIRPGDSPIRVPSRSGHHRPSHRRGHADCDDTNQAGTSRKYEAEDGPGVTPDAGILLPFTSRPDNLDLT